MQCYIFRKDIHGRIYEDFFVYIAAVPPNMITHNSIVFFRSVVTMSESINL